MSVFGAITASLCAGGGEKTRDARAGTQRIDGHPVGRTGARAYDGDVSRLPLLAGSRVQLVPVDDDAVRLRPPSPLEPLADIAGAVAEALRYPLSGAPLADRVTRGGRVTIVVEPPTLPVPGATKDPRQDALRARCSTSSRGWASNATGTRCSSPEAWAPRGTRELERLLQPGEARDYRGEIVVHDAVDDGLRSAGEVAGMPLALNAALLDTDLVVTVTAAETTDRGGAGALLAASSAEVVRHPQPAATLLQPSGSPGWELAAAVESAVGERAPPSASRWCSTTRA